MNFIFLRNHKWLWMTMGVAMGVAMGGYGWLGVAMPMVVTSSGDNKTMF